MKYAAFLMVLQTFKKIYKHKTTQYWPHNNVSFYKYESSYTTNKVFVNNIRKLRLDCQNIAACYPHSSFVANSPSLELFNNLLKLLFVWESLSIKVSNSVR